MIAFESSFARQRASVEPEPRFEPETLIDTSLAKFKDYQDFATEWIRSHPEISLGIAIGTGVVLGWISKRR